MVKNANSACTEIESFNKKMIAFISALVNSTESDLYKNHSLVTQFKTLINFSDDEDNHTKELNDVLNNMRTFKNLTELMKLLDNQKKLQLAIDKSMDNFEFTKSVNNIIKKRDDISSLMKQTSTVEVMKCFDGLKDSSDTLTTVDNAVTLTSEMNDITSDVQFFNDISTATKTIHESLSFLKDLLSGLHSIKLNQKPEVVELLKLKALDHDSKVFRDAVDALVHLKKVVDAEHLLDSLLEDGKHIDGEISKLKNPILRKEIMQYWKNFGKLQKDVSALKSMLKEKKDVFVTKRSKRSIEQFGKYFTKLAGFQDFNLDLETKLKGVNMLLNADNDKNTESVRNTLVKLSPLNLQFSKYNTIFPQVSATLKAMQNTFESVLKIATNVFPSKAPIPNFPIRTSKPVKTAQTLTPNRMSLMSGVETSTAESETSKQSGWGLGYLFLAGFLGFVITSVGFVIYFKFCHLSPESSSKKIKKLKEEIKILKLQIQEKTNEWKSVSDQSAASRQDFESTIAKLNEIIAQKTIEIETISATSNANQQENKVRIKQQRITSVIVGKTSNIKAVWRNFKKMPDFSKWESYERAITNKQERFNEVDKEVLLNFMGKHTCPYTINKIDINPEKTLQFSFYDTKREFCTASVDHFLKKKRKQFGNSEISCWTTTMVGGKNSEISANRFYFPIGYAIISKFPQSDREKVAFWAIVWEENITVMVYFGTKGDEALLSKLSNQLIKHGSFQMKVSGAKNEAGYIVHEIKIKNDVTGTEKIIQHYSCQIWLEDDIPKNEQFKEGFRTIQSLTMRQTNGRCLAYDKNGSFKAATFLSVEFVVQKLIYEGNIVCSFDEMLFTIEQMRGNVFTNGDQLMFILIMSVDIILKGINEDRNENMQKEWNRFYEFHNKEFDQKRRENVRERKRLQSEQDKREKENMKADYSELKEKSEKVSGDSLVTSAPIQKKEKSPAAKNS